MNFILKLRKIHGAFYEWRKRHKAIKRLQINMKESSFYIMTIDETLYNLEKGKSLCRFGDGEMDIILGKSIGFQKFDANLSEELKNILIQTPENCLIAVPDAINTFDNLTSKSTLWWTNYMLANHEYWINLLNTNYHYGNTNVSRCYIRYENKEHCSQWFKRIMNLWRNREVVIIEGSQTRLGCGNDFLNHALSVERILASPENAFSRKDEIEAYVQQNISTDKLILLALGPTATIIAYDLSQCGYQALDIGHCDIEYEWYKRGTKEKIAIKGKYTNEAKNGKIVDDSLINKKYLDQIIMRFI